MADLYNDAYWTHEFDVTVANLDRLAQYGLDVDYSLNYDCRR